MKRLLRKKGKLTVPRRRESDKHPVRFNGEISIGTILSLVAMLVSLYGFYSTSNQKVNDGLNRVDTRLAIVESKVDAMWKSVITGQAD